jgi:TRAP-type C4-dicarboxylate transport system permease small subunit
MKPIETVLSGIAAIAVLAMMGVTVVDVIGRSLLNRPLPGGTVLIELTMLVTAFALYPVIVLRKLHIVVDLFDPLIRHDWMRRFQQALVSVLGTGLFGALAWQMWITAGRQLKRGEVTGSLDIPLAWLSWFMAVMSLLTAIAFLILLVSVFTTRGFGPTSSNPEGKL